MPVLEADDVLQPAQAGNRFWFENSVVALIDNHAKAGPGSNPAVMFVESLLLRLQEIRWQNEQSVGSCLFGCLRKTESHPGSIARAGDHRQTAAGLFHRRLHQAPEFGQVERKEFSRSAACEERRGFALHHPGDVLPVTGKVNLQTFGEGRDGKGKQPS